MCVLYHMIFLSLWLFQSFAQIIDFIEYFVVSTISYRKNPHVCAALFATLLNFLGILFAVAFMLPSFHSWKQQQRKNVHNDLAKCFEWERGKSYSAHLLYWTVLIGKVCMTNHQICQFYQLILHNWLRCSFTKQNTANFNSMEASRKKRMNWPWTWKIW